MPEILGEMVESCAPSGRRACSVRSPCTCRSPTVGILEIAGFRRQYEGFCQARAPSSGKSQCVEGGVIFAAWWSRQCAFKLSILSPTFYRNPEVFSFVFKNFSSILIYFQVRLGPGPLRCPSLTRLPVWEPIPGPLLTNHPCSAVRAQIISSSDDLVVSKLPACGCE